MRRLLVVLVVAVVVAGAPSWAQKGPIKVGLLVPQTGPLAANGKDMINGFELFFEEHKYRLAGREIKFIVEDDEGKPATGITKARGLVEGQGVHLLTGPLSAAGARSLFPILVPTHLWERANAFDSSSHVLASLVGAPIGGVLVALAGGAALFRLRSLR